MSVDHTRTNLANSFFQTKPACAVLKTGPNQFCFYNQITHGAMIEAVIIMSAVYFSFQQKINFFHFSKTLFEKNNVSWV